MRYDEDWLRKRKERVQTIIDGLKDYGPFQLLIEDKKNAVRFSDDNWHMIDIEDKNKLLELKYNKLAAMSIVNCIKEYQNELNSYDNDGADSTYWMPDSGEDSG